MIVEMRRVLVFGPKRLLAPVMEEVQRLGVLHVDRIEAEEASLSALQLDETASAQQAALERLRIRADALLGLLPAVPGDSHIPGGDSADLADADVDALESALAAIENEVRALSRRRLEAEEERELIKTYEGAVRVLSPLLGALRDSKSVETVGFILRGKDLTVVQALRNQLNELTNGRVEVVSRTIEEGKIGVVVAFLHRDAEAVRNFLTQAGISELRLPARYAEAGPAEAVRLMQQRREALPRELAEIDAALAEAARRYRPRVTAIRGLVADRLARLRALPNLVESRYTFILYGWAPASRMAEVRAALRRRFGHDVIVHDVPADPHDTAGVPVLLDNPAPIRPFQRLLALFRPPRYGTLDPTVYLAIFFPIFVGMVVGDVAIGILLFAFGWWMRNKAQHGETWDIEIPWVRINLGIRVPPDALADMSWIVRILAIWTILFGVLYLEVFGNLIEHHFHVQPIFNRVELTTTFFYITVAAGLVQVMLGYLLHLMIAVRHRHLVGVLESLAMISGVSALFAILGAMGNILPASYFTPGIALAAAFLVFVLIGIVLNRMAAMWLLEAISGMGNVLSYARLFGVGLAAAVLANVANELGGMFGPIWIGILLGIIIQLGILVFTFAGHVIQPARLNWVEFLTKFKYHDETGNSYQPLHKTGGD
ncbi:MAG: V-type ATP synthase subunit I [Armatimonadota bacterium]